MFIKFLLFSLRDAINDGEEVEGVLIIFRSPSLSSPNYYDLETP